jgi:hypothetical protein
MAGKTVSLKNRGEDKKFRFSPLTVSNVDFSGADKEL